MGSRTDGSFNKKLEFRVKGRHVSNFCQCWLLSVSRSILCSIPIDAAI